MTDSLASIPARPVPAEPPSNSVPGLEDDTVDTGQFWSTEEGPSFAEFLDIINPLQHIPIVSTIYRAITEDQIGAGPRFIGGVLFGGPIGALAAGFTSLFEEASGDSIGDHVASLVDDVFGGEDNVPENSALNAPRDEKRDPAQIAALPAEAPAAAAVLNRISLNPAAALGVAQNTNATTRGQQAGNLFGGLTRPPAVPTAQPAPVPAAVRPMAVPFGGAPDTTRPDATEKNINTSRMDDALARSRRQQTDLLLAQWAAQQMAAQEKSGQTRQDTTETKNRNGTASHPMLPPRNASPEWYAQAMDRALSQYKQAGQTVQPAGSPGFPGLR